MAVYTEVSSEELEKFLAAYDIGRAVHLVIGGASTGGTLSDVVENFVAPAQTSPPEREKPPRPGGGSTAEAGSSLSAAMIPKSR